jgi:ABC-type transport system involved in multi-copper enzyme maturation permease subunit
MEAGTVPDRAIISHRGEKYEIGRGRRFYGIWAVGAPYEAPVDRWPENPDGWRQAWARFAAIEVPGTIAGVTRERKNPLTVTGSRPGASTTLLAGEGLLVLGVVLGLAGLFPGYAGGQSLLSQWDQVVPHLCYVIGWMVTAALVALSVARPGKTARLGALFGLGLSAVTFGLFLADLGQVVSGAATLGSGLVVSLLGWAACTAGAALALKATGERPAQPAAPAQPGAPAPWSQAGRSGPARPGHAGPLALLVLAALGVAAAFAPSWDSYTLVATATGTSQTITAGNAFNNPALVIAGNVIVMLAVVVVAALAALWRPARQGALLLAGAIVPLAAEVPAAMIQAGQHATPAMFGISSAQAAAAGLTISSGLTGIFWVFFVFVISLIVSCAWLFTEPEHPVMPGFPTSPWLPAAGDQGSADADGAAVSEDADSDVSEDEDPDGAVSTESEAADTGTTTEGGGQSAYA